MANIEINQQATLGFERDIETSFTGRFTPVALEVPHVLSAAQLTPEYLDDIFTKTAEFKRQDGDLDAQRELAGRYVGRKLCSLFYEPSTRTRTSFEAAAVDFGMGVVSTENAREFSSAAKGETIEDTIRVLNEYNFDAIVMRHHETGGAARAAAVSETPIINAGDGKGEHPTQSLLDAFTIYENHGRLDDLHVVMGGDLANGRTVRSLAQVLNLYPGNRLTFVAPELFQMGDDIKQILRDSGTHFEQTTDVRDTMKDADVVYWTRLQKERLTEEEFTPEAIELILGNFVLTGEIANLMPEDSIIMHPLPRVGEITTDVDSNPRARYFEQAGNGRHTRKAILDSILSQRS